jgi:hypothetical protein
LIIIDENIDEKITAQQQEIEKEVKFIERSNDLYMITLFELDC